MRCAMQVLAVEQCQEFRVGDVVLPGEFDQCADRLQRIEFIEVQGLLGIADAGVGLLRAQSGRARPCCRSSSRSAACSSPSGPRCDRCARRPDHAGRTLRWLPAGWPSVSWPGCAKSEQRPVGPDPGPGEVLSVEEFTPAILTNQLQASSSNPVSPVLCWYRPVVCLTISSTAS